MVSGVRVGLRWAGSALLWAGALAGVLGLALFVGVRSGYVQTLVVISGSMQPTYHVGDGLVSRRVPASAVRVGDVVSARNADGVLVTHRVVGVEDGPGDARTLTLRGDANSGDDPAPYVVERTYVPVVTVPHAKAFVDVVRRPTVGIPLVVAACALVGFALVPSGGPRRQDDVPGGGTDEKPAPTHRYDQAS
ncbi:signal peptidase I [Luteimicrobium album]|nr:signal peptidase I [Luteimicrobium album]